MIPEQRIIVSPAAIDKKFEKMIDVRSNIVDIIPTK